MVFLGETRCPNCDCPIDTDSLVCSYCHSTEPATADWQQKMTPGMWLAFGLVLLGLFVGWYCFGIDWYELISHKD